MRQRLLQHGLLIVAAAAWSLAAPGIGSAHADDSQVTVVDAGGSQRTLSLEALAGGEDVIEHSYALRSADGESTQTVTGFSPAAILDAAGVDPYGFSYLEVQRPASGSVLLSRHQALDQGAFPEGTPVIYATAAGTGFLRPSAGAGDLNATDSFDAPQGLTVVLHSGSPLQVRAKASTLRTRPGQPVTFTAIVERAGAGEQLAYSWYFDDGSSSTGPSTRHRFAKRGSYDVVVGVTTPGDDAGASAVVTVQVGAPLAGPARKGGGRNRDAEAPDHGAASGKGDATPPRVAGGPPAAATTQPASQDKPSRRRERSPARTIPAGQRVSGLLLDEKRTAAPLQPTAARTGQLSEDGGGAGLPDAALGLLVTVGLLGAGALVETRSLHR